LQHLPIESFCRAAVPQVPRQIGQRVHGCDGGDHDRESQREVGGQDVQNRRSSLGPRHVEIIRAGDQRIDVVRDARENQQRGEGLERGFHRRTHAVHEDHVENRHITQRVLHPELVVTVARRTGIGQRRGRRQRKQRTGQQPEIADVKQRLLFADQHEAAENHRPAAYADGQRFDSSSRNLRQRGKTPIVGHIADDQRKRDHIPQGFLPLAPANPVAQAVNQRNHAQHEQDGRKMRKRQQSKLRFSPLTEEVTEKLLHSYLLYTALLSHCAMIFRASSALPLASSCSRSCRAPGKSFI